MLDTETKRKIDNCRDMLVGKLPSPQSQVEQITIALIYKFMDDMDCQSVEMGGKRSFFTGEYSKYAWSNIFDPKIGGFELLSLYGEALVTMNQNPNIPQLFRDIFKNAFLPYRDPETLRNFLKEINKFSYDHSERLGDAFEYLLSVLSSQGDAGQFRTPRHIIDFIVEIVDPQKNETVLDPACGTGGFLISAHKHIVKSNTGKKSGDLLTPAERKRILTNFSGYDISPDMVRLSLVNMYLHGFRDPKIFEYDTLTSEERWNETADVILANPPFMTPKGGIKPHKRFSIQANRSEVLFVDYMVEHLNPSGRAGIIVPEGIIFQSQNSYKALRKMLVENYLWAVVSLPAGIFNPYSGVKTSVLLMDKSIAKKTDSILFVKIENDGFGLGAQRREIQGSDLPDIIEFIKRYKVQSIKQQASAALDTDFAHIVKKEEIAKSGDYNLTGERYRTFEHHQQSFWPMVELGEVFVEIRNGKNVEQIDDKGNYRVTRIQTIANGSVDLNKTKWTNDDVSENYFMQYGDILLSHINSIEHLAKTAIFKNITEKVVHGINLIRFRPDFKKILPEFALACFKTDLFTDKAKTMAQKAVNQASMKTSDLRQMKIPLPPLDVQERIVAEIEGYQKIIDGARQITENYKPTIKINPEWEMVELGKVFKLSSGKSLTSSQRLEGSYNVYGGNGITGYHNDYFLKKPTLIIGRVGEYCGAVHITEPQSWVTDNALHVVEYLIEVCQNYLAIILEHINLNKYAKVGGQPSISQTTIYNIKIPLPPLEEQQQIVSQIESEQKMVNETKKLIEIFENKIKTSISEVWGNANG